MSLPVGLVLAFAIWTVTLLIARAARSPLVAQNTKGLGIVMAAATVLLLGTHSYAESSSAEEILADPLGSGAGRIARGGLIVICLVLLFPTVARLLRRLPATGPWPGLGALTAYISIAFVSILYSSAPLVTAAKAVEIAAGLVIIWVLALRPNPRHDLRLVIRYVVLLEGALVVGAMIGFFAAPDLFYRVQPWKPGWLFLPSMTSPFAHANSLSARGALVATYAMAMILTSPSVRSRLLWTGLFLVQTVGVLMASGRQGVLILMAGVALLLLIHKPRLSMLVLAPVAIVATFAYSQSLFGILARGQPEALGQLSGRLGFWQAAVDVWAKEPVTGYGFGIGGRFVALRGVSSTVSHLHSGYMELLSGLGLLGLVPLAYCVYRAGLWALRKLRAREETELAILLVPLLLQYGFCFVLG
jgi:O-antigen ligase